MRKALYAFALAIAAFVLASTLALAGGWAVVTLDQLPTQVVSGRPVTIGFIVRQHGVTPTNNFAPVITAHSTETGETLNVVPNQSGPVGHFVAEVTFPSAGVWNWSITTVFEQPMPPLTVRAAVPAQAPPVTVKETSPLSILPLGIGLLGLIVGVLALFIWQRTRTALALPLLLIGVAIGIAGFALAVMQASSPPAQAASAPSVARADLVQKGKGLFLAKGCVVCHQNAAVADWQGSFRSVQVGPNLTNLKLTSDYLHRWLKDPSAVKPGTEMPTLGLSEDEIDALAAFLTQP